MPEISTTTKGGVIALMRNDDKMNEQLESVHFRCSVLCSDALARCRSRPCCWQMERKVEEAMKASGAEMKQFWGSTLYHLEDLPFDLEAMPTTYGGFRERVHDVKIRPTIDLPDQLKGLPAACNLDCGEMPTLEELGVRCAYTRGPTPNPLRPCAQSNQISLRSRTEIRWCSAGMRSGVEDAFGPTLNTQLR